MIAMLVAVTPAGAAAGDAGWCVVLQALDVKVSAL
eukprot:SAG11_NODE_20055_length_453_cov_1.607345_2_plen_34_part_01